MHEMGRASVGILLDYTPPSGIIRVDRLTTSDALS